MVHALRDLGGVTFLTLRTREGLIQCVCPRRPEGVREECAVSVSGLLRPEPRAPGGAELAEARCTVLSLSLIHISGARVWYNVENHTLR